MPDYDPSQLFSPSKVCELALQNVGAFSPNDSAPDPVELERALDFLELEIAELVGTQTAQWLIPTPISFYLNADEESFNLQARAGNNLPTLLMAAPIRAYIIDSGDNETEIKIVRKSDYESHVDKSTTGTPDEIHIDRLNDDPTVFVYPVPGDDTLRLKLLFQTYSRTVLNNTQVAANEDGSASHGFDVAWQNWMVLRTSYRIGQGPVRRLRSESLDRFAKDAKTSFDLLMGAQNREKHSMKVRRTRRYGG